MVTYAVQPIALPAGWQVATQQVHAEYTKPPQIAAVMGRDGTVAVLLSRIGDLRERPRRLLILHPDGRKAILSAHAATVMGAFQLHGAATVCRQEPSSCPFFYSVALTADGRPFATFAYLFAGAYSGTDYAGFVWKAGWHALPAGTPPFGGLGRPRPPTNVLVPAADAADAYVIVGDFSNSFPGEDLTVAAHDPHFMVDVSAAVYRSRMLPLGEADVTAMRGDFIAGVDADRKLVASHSPRAPAAIVWRCAARRQTSKRVCVRTREPGNGIAYDVDTRGNAVGDDEGVIGELGYPLLWRGNKAIPLSSMLGTAYGIGEDGTIAGTIGTNGFVADARDAQPRSRYLDDLVPNESVHVQAALGVADDGRILGSAQRADRSEELIVLKPARVSRS